MTKPLVVSLAPQSHVNWMMRPPIQAAWRAEFEVWQHDEPRHLAPEEAMEPLREAAAVFTGWGARPFSPEVLAAMPNLKIAAHLAGSPRPLFAGETVREVLVPRGIVVYTGASSMAQNVAEATIGLMILAARRWPLHESAFRARVQRRDAGAPKSQQITARDAQFLLGATVGIVSASQVARRVLPLLRAFECRVLIYDPFLSEEAARELGAELSGLDEMFERADIVSLHAPDLPATRGMIGAELLARMRDGAVLVNTSRGPILDHEALWRECASGRIYAALDVTEPEPLPPDSPAWDLENVFLLPHTAGEGRAGYARIGSGALQAVRDALAGRAVSGAVPLERWETVA